MQLEDYRGFVSSLAVVFTILQFLSGILVCKQYVQNKTTADSSPLPFLCGVLSSGIWFFYGLVKRDDIMILVNAFGLTHMTSYVIVFYIYTYKKSMLLKQISLCLLLSLIIFSYALIEENKQVILDVLGLAGCSLTLLTVASPMSQLFYVIRVKNTSCLPFPLIIMTFIVSTSWLLYGLLQNDSYLIMPNCIGAILGLIQLSLFVIFPSQPMSSNQRKTLQA